MLYLSNDLDFYNELVAIVDNKIGNWSMILVEAFMNFNNHPLPHFRIKLLEAITPLISGDLFIKLLHNAYIILETSILQGDFLLISKELVMNIMNPSLVIFRNRKEI